MSDYIHNQQALGVSVGEVELQSATFPSLALDSGRVLEPVTIAYEMYGALNEERTNAVLILHALSGDAHAAGYYSGDSKPGWWETMIGPGKGFDTDRYFVICSNVIGGCKGSSGPSSINPATGREYGVTFPFVTVGDMVRAQKHLVDHLGHPQATRRGRRLDGGDAGAGMGRRVPRNGLFMHLHRLDPAPFAHADRL